MTYVGQLLVAGISLGSVYALVALGFVLIYRAANVINFAQGDFAMLGGYLMLLAVNGLHFPYWLAILAVLVAMAAFGSLFAVGIYYPLRNRSWVPVMISTLGVSILLENGTQSIVGPTPAALQGAFGSSTMHIGHVVFDDQYALIIVITILLVIGQHFFFERTLLGKKMQAVSQDKGMAQMLGIPVGLIITLIFVMSSILAGFAGLLVGPILFVSIQLGTNITLKAFAATIIGGFGSVTGAVAGGVLVGLIDTFGGAYISLPYKDAFSFLVVVAVLLVRPQGLFGERVGEKA